jgi:nicotinamidase-related amidase
MTSVISLLDFKEWRSTTPTLVFVGLHDDLSSVGGEEHEVDLTETLANCRVALAHARTRGFPIAFVRQIETPPSFTGAVRFPAWFAGFEPRRSDMVFDRQQPSCYASPEFVDMNNHTGGNCVIAGLFGESSCLSTAVDAYHRNHQLTYLADASMSRGHRGISAAAMHEAVTSIVSLYGRVVKTQTWMRMTSQRAEAAR